MNIKKPALLLCLTIIMPFVLPGKAVPLPGLINPESIARAKYIGIISLYH